MKTHDHVKFRNQANTIAVNRAECRGRSQGFEGSFLRKSIDREMMYGKRNWGHADPCGQGLQPPRG